MKMEPLVVTLLFFILTISPCSANTKNTIFQVTSTLENDITQPQYNYAENLQDGRGITFGFCGFCTGTYDGNALIKYYTKLNPDNPLKKYIPALDKIDAEAHSDAYHGGGNPSVAGLDDFITDVQNCKDPLFKQAQLYELDQFYWNPTVEEFNWIGAKYPITLAIMYDASVRYGVDGMQEIVSKCGEVQPDESAFDRRFIAEYTKVLMDEGLEDTDRMDGYSELLQDGNVCLKTPFTFIAYGQNFVIK